MTKLMKTNSKRYQANMDKYLFDCINSEDLELKTLQQKIAYAMECFNNYDSPFNQRRFPNLQARFADFLQGLPFAFDYWNDDILRAVAVLHEIDKVPENKEQVVLNNYYSHLAYNILKRAK